MSYQIMRALLCSVFMLPAVSTDNVALVTGATGRTGSLVYGQLKKEGKFSTLRALVTNITKAREVLHCTKCDESEGIFVADVTDSASLAKAFAGVSVVADVVGVGGAASAKTVEKVEFEGVKNQVAALAKGGVSGKRFVMVSSMGTTDPPQANNTVFFYKLNAEAFVESAGVPYSIIKPCGLGTDAGAQRELMVSPDSDAEDWFTKGFYMIPREDVAAVTVAAMTGSVNDAMRFDLCAKKQGTGPPKPAADLLKDAVWPWQKPSANAILA